MIAQTSAAAHADTDAPAFSDDVTNLLVAWPGSAQTE